MSPQLLPSEFDISLWLGQSYAENKDNHLIQEQKQYLLSVPLYIFEKYFPSENLSIANFVRISLPQPLNPYFLPKLDTWFSKDEPNTDLGELMNPGRVIPSKKFLIQLEDAFGQAWFHGAKSIVDWLNNGSQDRLPFAAIQLWHSLHTILVSHIAWKNAYKYIQNIERLPCINYELKLLGQEVLKAFDILGWKQSLPRIDKPYYFSLDLISLLSESEWLKDNTINIILEEISYRHQKLFPLKAQVIEIVDSHFSTTVIRVYKFENKAFNSRSALVRMAKKIQSQGIQELYFPIHTGHTQHWVAGIIDFRQKEVRYGMICFIIIIY
jgi:hypothetical protein